MDKELLILVDYVDIKAIDPDLLARCDRLAMTSDAMLAFEQNGLSYLTFKDFYDHDEFRDDNIELIKSTEDFLSKLDKKYESFVNFPRAFTGNIFWFLFFFTDSYYIHTICKKINMTYDKVYLWGSSTYKASFKIDLEFSSEGLSFHKCRAGLINKVNMLRAYLHPECFWASNVYHKRSNLNIDKNRLINLVKQASKTMLSGVKSFFAKWTHREKRIVFIIQDGYEVSLLRQHMLEFGYVNPVDKLLRMVKNAGGEGLKLDPLFTGELEKFIKRWFPNFEKQVLELFSAYHRKILCHLDFFQKNLEKIFERNKPIALFYSACANRVYEDICAYLANRKNVPVYYFQHGGATVFYEHLYLKYSEHNRNIEKTNTFHSKIEKQIFADHVSSESRALGSSKIYNVYKTPREPRKKVLYCTGPFNAYNYKDLMTNVPDTEIFKVNKDIINAVGGSDLGMDIKVHPNDEAYNYTYFNNLLDAKQCENINVLRGIFAEKIIKDYELLILDYVATVLVPIVIAIDIPVILYLKDVSYLRKETRPDLEKRFYIVRDKSDLEKHIGLYARGKLESKFSRDIINEYNFPVDSGDPSISISEFIRERIHEKVKV